MLPTIHAGSSAGCYDELRLSCSARGSGALMIRDVRMVRALTVQSLTFVTDPVLCTELADVCLRGGQSNEC